MIFLCWKTIFVGDFDSIFECRNNLVRVGELLFSFCCSQIYLKNCKQGVTSISGVVLWTSNTFPVI